ncbi:MAG: polymer-forming cytoskeletal protein [Nitrospirae bacterium]|nr:polymer-forming cytoskeletal protein [Nitrospirota bacterium]MBF0541754.1 polymer-forming cytoskeletal protein [Nitrospirota bacterium]
MSKKNNSMDSIIGVNSIIKGEVEVKGTIRIDGRFEGIITADWVIIGKTGYVEGKVTASAVMVSGQIIGKVNSSDFVEIKETGKMIGDIETDRIIILEGGRFEGKSIVKRDMSKKKTPELISNN